MEYDDLLDGDLVNKPHPEINLALVATIPLFGGGLLGLVTNFINGSILRQNYTFFRMIYGFREGIVFGLVFGVVFTIIVARSSRRRLKIKQLLKAYMQCAAIVIGLWAVAGCIGAVLYHCYPEIAPRLTTIAKRLHAAIGWVNVSVWGTRLGALVAFCWAAFITRKKKVEVS